MGEYSVGGGGASFFLLSDACCVSSGRVTLLGKGTEACCMVLPIDPEKMRTIWIIAKRKVTSILKQPIMLILRMHTFLAYGQGSNSRQGQDFSLLQSVNTGSRAHTASNSMGIGGSFPGGKLARV